jgi:hypothetical protein
MEKNFNSRGILYLIIDCLLIMMFESCYLASGYDNPVSYGGTKKDTLIIHSNERFITSKAPV